MLCSFPEFIYHLLIEGNIIFRDDLRFQHFLWNSVFRQHVRVAVSLELEFSLTNVTGERRLTLRRPVNLSEVSTSIAESWEWFWTLQALDLSIVHLYDAQERRTVWKKHRPIYTLNPRYMVPFNIKSAIQFASYLWNIRHWGLSVLHPLLKKLLPS